MHSKYAKNAFEVIKGPLRGHFRFDKRCFYEIEIWHEWSSGKSKHIKNIFYVSTELIRGSQRSKRSNFKQLQMTKVAVPTCSPCTKQLKFSMMPSSCYLWLQGQRSIYLRLCTSDCLQTQNLQSCAKLVGTHALPIIITLIIKMYVYKMTCMIQYPCSKHPSSPSLPPHQAMLVYTCFLFIPSALSLTTLILLSGEQSFYYKMSQQFRTRLYPTAG